MQKSLQVITAIVIGLMVRLLLPGQHSISLLLAGMLSLVGALAGAYAANRLFAREKNRPVEFAVSALGALAMLLLYGVATQ